jgi:hypothetical protein
MAVSFTWLGAEVYPFILIAKAGANSVNDQQQRERIWISPQKFWAVTKNMSSEETEKLMDTVTRLAQEDRIDLLKKFEFISVGDPYHHQAC